MEINRIIVTKITKTNNLTPYFYVGGKVVLNLLFIVELRSQSLGLLKL